ncbi:MAG: recombinase family protein [Legionellaceae bacterium]|nr:recombinase family protein [Legionellaceae bacterium]
MLTDLKIQHLKAEKGKMLWDRSTIWYMLKNPAYKGEASNSG